jgi:hypothetical protein
LRRRLLHDGNEPAGGLATQSIAATRTEAAQRALVVDTDGDGLTDVQERSLGTVINSKDSDGDGLFDKAEVDGGTNPTNPDSDGDALNDGDEKLWRTDPNAPDSDGDTLQDGLEVNLLGTSPINVDTDGDGLNDNVDPDPGKLPTPPSPAPPPSPTIPADSISFNCDGTAAPEHLDGISGKTITVDKWSAARGTRSLRSAAMR